MYDESARMPVEFVGKREAEIFERVKATRPSVSPGRTELLAAVVRALADEETAREEMARAMAGGDVNSAKIYGALARDMRAQATQLLADVPDL